jgi:hypothetical protein
VFTATRYEPLDADEPTCKRSYGGILDSAVASRKAISRRRQFPRLDPVGPRAQKLAPALGASALLNLPIGRPVGPEQNDRKVCEDLNRSNLTMMVSSVIVSCID